MKKRILQVLLLLGTVAWLTTPFLVAPSGQEVVNETAIVAAQEEDIIEVKPWFEGWTTSVVNVREEPSEQAKILKVYSEYEYLHFYEYDNDWIAIILMSEPDMSSGGTPITAYIRKDYITTDKVEIEYRQLVDRRTVTEEWYVEYKNFINLHSDEYDSPETIYNCFTNEELDLLFRVVQAEIGDEYTFEQKVNVANSIFNRLYSDKRSFAYQETLLEVLRKDQFSTISNNRYKRVKVSDVTRNACEYAFYFPDTTDGALFFDSNGSLNYEFLFNDGAHTFYTIKE